MIGISIKSLADEVATAARIQGVRPNRVIDDIFLRENVLDPEIRSLVLQELGRRGGKKSALVRKHNSKIKKVSEKERTEIFRIRAMELKKKESWDRAIEANEHTCPID